MTRFIVFLLVMLGPAAASAQGAPLTLDEVLRSSARSAPQIVEALAKVRQADGRALSAEGAFDTVFDVESKSRVAGYYDGTVVEGRATRPLTGNGGYVYGGYRASRGTFPVYEDQAYTNRLGEAKVGALFALLRDRVIDERRTRRTIAGTEIDVARFEADMVAIGVQRRAVDAYQAWVAAGLRLRAYRDLLQLAERRRSAIGRLVTLGARPEILLVENDQNLVRRRALTVRAEQDVAGAANALSLYLRDEAGAPVTVSDDRMPADAGALAALSVAATRAGPVERPDYRAVLARIDQATSRLALAQTTCRPGSTCAARSARMSGRSAWVAPTGRRSRLPSVSGSACRCRTAPPRAALQRRAPRSMHWATAAAFCAIRLPSRSRAS